MTLPPFFVRIHIVENGKNRIRLWFPVFLIWLIMFILALALTPIVLVAALILWQRKLGKKLLLFGPLFFCVLSSLHNLDVQTESPGNKVSISFR